MTKRIKDLVNRIEFTESYNLVQCKRYHEKELSEMRAIYRSAQKKIYRSKFQEV